MNFFKKKDTLLFLAMLSFVFVSSTALAISNSIPDIVRILPVQAKETKTFPPNPVLMGGDFPVLSAQGVLAVDLDSGVSLYEKNPDRQLLPASTAKIVTALVALDIYQLDQILTVPNIHVIGQKMGLYAGEQMRVEDLLYALLVFSANDAAETIAQNHPDGRDAFIEAMNIKAKDLSMVDSQFHNPVGLDGVSQFTTARDLARVSEVAMRNPDFARMVGTDNVFLTDVTGKTKYNLNNINRLLGVIPGVTGVKTGWTENARENLVTHLERDGHRIIIVILGSQDRFGETTELIDWIFASYRWEEVKP